MGVFDKLRDRLKEVEEQAMDAAVEVEELMASDEDLEAELEAELAAMGDGGPDEAEEEATAATAPETRSTPVPEDAARPEPEPESASKPQPTSETDPRAAPEPAPKPKPEPVASSPSRAKPAVRTEGKYAIDPDRVEDLLWDLELVLLEADVAIDVAHELRDEVESRIAEIRVDAKDEIPDAIEDALRGGIRSLLSGGRFDFDGWMMEQEKRPLTIMFIGVNGTGKTTTIGRVAYRLKELGFGVALAAGDTFRAGAIEQLERHGEKLGLRVIKHSAGSDPAAVAYDALEHAKARKKDVVLLDTAGRMQTNLNLMDEMRKVARVAKPDLTVFVGDSLAGNDAIEQAKKFQEAVGIDCCVLTKVDTDAKGGAALSIARAVGKPVAFLGVGQNYDDLIPFEPEWLIERIFGE